MPSILAPWGIPRVPDHISLWGLLIPIRRLMRQWVNLRPVRLMPGVPTPLKDRGPQDIDFVVIRENSEGEYSEIGGRLDVGGKAERAEQLSVFTRTGVDRIIRYAFEMARSRPKKHLTSATKSNGIMHTMPFWDERFRAIGEEYPDVRADQYHVDILAANFVLHPDWFDVVVGSNLFGDILSDLGPAVAGTIGIAPSANINPEGDYPSMFEPVHGSAPDIMGKGIANPIGQIWSGAMMLRHLGEDVGGLDAGAGHREGAWWSRGSGPGTWGGRRPPRNWERRWPGWCGRFSVPLRQTDADGVVEAGPSPPISISSGNPSAHPPVGWRASTFPMG